VLAVFIKYLAIADVVSIMLLYHVGHGGCNQGGWAAGGSDHMPVNYLTTQREFWGTLGTSERVLSASLFNSTLTLFSFHPLGNANYEGYLYKKKICTRYMNSSHYLDIYRICYD